MRKHFDVTVTGTVQGVFFRASTHSKAREIGVFGFVRNEVNGDVYIEVEGQEDDLKKFLEWCAVGPPHARVIRIEVKEGALKNFRTFEIAR
jgi:acylphosphatase